MEIFAEHADEGRVGGLKVLTETVTVNVARDPAVYGDVRFRLYDPQTEQYLSGVEVVIEGQTVRSDETGLVTLTIPLAAQKKTYPIMASIPLHEDSLYMPCGDTYCIFRQ